MNNFFRYLLFVLISGAIMGAARCEEFSMEEINHYSIQLLSDYVLVDVTPKMADFELVEVVNKEHPDDKLSIYFGNAPHFPAYDWKESPSESEGEGMRKTTYNYRQRDGAMEGMLVFSGLSYRGSKHSPYSRIHYFANAVNKETSDRFLKVIESIRVVRPNI